ncbi:formylglycine-generating enzyme family protein [Maridesulfovibrio sp. FT414]|uniref:formylglycine-generating enzyme family protein n=1 Tax=Maridesulfovibrio sp. FT414 TaxID=2979469 RepID=UPI003D80997E
MPLGFIDNGVPPSPFPPEWASTWGQDRYGLWAALQIEGVEQVMRWMRPGIFMMGSPEAEPERSGGEILHEVTLTKGYWLADTACTQELWTEVMGKNPSSFKSDIQLPVESVSWGDCQEFLRSVENINQGLNFRLPTEAEWEYGCRAGTVTPFSFGKNITSAQVNYNGNSSYDHAPRSEYRNTTVPVKYLPCNQWGLYQMHGNVLEWCADWFGEYPEGSSLDPKGFDSGDSRVMRGGSWLIFGGRVRSAYRNWSRPDLHFRDFGFRFVLGPKE